jgi:hypothetical protein
MKIGVIGSDDVAKVLAGGFLKQSRNAINSGFQREHLPCSHIIKTNDGIRLLQSWVSGRVNRSHCPARAINSHDFAIVRAHYRVCGPSISICRPTAEDDEAQDEALVDTETRCCIEFNLPAANNLRIFVTS